MKAAALLTLLSFYLLSPPIAARALEPFSADYQLMFNGEQVGKAFFSLKLQDNQQYNFEVFTLPTSTLAAGEEKQEILEASNGQLRDGIPVPDSYYYAVRKQSTTELLEFFYDWKGLQLTMRSDKAQVSIDLQPDSQDTLSYLLYAMILAMNHKVQAEFPLYTPDDTTRTRLRLKNKHYQDLPAGRLLLQEVEQYRGTGSKPDRTLWLAADRGYVPALLENRNGEDVVRMELLRLSR